MLEQLFENSPNYEDEQLKNMLDSLTDITYEDLENINKINSQTAKENISTQTNKKINNEAKTFSIDKMYKEEWSEENFQQKLFSPWKSIMNCRFADLKTIIMGQILKMIQNCGHLINHKGWTQILIIFQEISQDSDQPYINIDDNNMNYLSCDMFWNIADYIYKAQDIKQTHYTISNEEFAELIRTILSRIMSLCLDSHTEVRHSALHIFSTLIINNCSRLSGEFWSSVFQDMLFKLAQSIISKLKTLDDGEQAMVWQDTAKNLIQNISKILKKFFINFAYDHQNLNNLNYQIYSSNKKLKRNSNFASQNLKTLNKKQDNNGNHQSQNSPQINQFTVESNNNINNTDNNNNNSDIQSQQSSQRVIQMKDNQQKQAMDQSGNSHSSQNYQIQQNEQKQENYNEVLIFFYDIFIEIVNMQKYELILDSLKAFREIFNLRPYNSLKIKNNFQPVLDTLDNLFTTVPKNLKQVKIIVQKLSNEMCLFVSDFINLSSKIYLQIENFNEYLAFVMALFYKVIVFPKISDTTFNLVLNKIFYDDKEQFEIITQYVNLLNSSYYIKQENSQIKEYQNEDKEKDEQNYSENSDNLQTPKNQQQKQKDEQNTDGIEKQQLKKQYPQFKQNQHLLPQYFEDIFINFLTELFSSPKDDKFYDGIFKSILPCLVQFLNNKNMLEKEYTLQIIQFIFSCVETKIQEQYIHFQINEIKNQDSLWQLAIPKFIMVAQYYIENEKHVIDIFDILIKYFQDKANNQEQHEENKQELQSIGKISQEYSQKCLQILFSVCNSYFEDENTKDQVINNNLQNDSTQSEIQKNSKNLDFDQKQNNNNQLQKEKIILCLPFLLSRNREIIEDYLKSNPNNPNHLCINGYDQQLNSLVLEILDEIGEIMGIISIYNEEQQQEL
ncbi:Armadillo-type fold [Pseudocohnilembus persalinus]|uniref:Armadillo-type fold n=1 Tax=Pseudocohnilembus persalinus TaxID=266149 RepID=A0A0V0QW75_PSEPJ|nr:Armadillo-type fold [Pseudocohnilembus persalinus]|eukprot:KRX06452.1 Armadillo-type fold [Pseudocohnilembus persalinus]